MAKAIQKLLRIDMKSLRFIYIIEGVIHLVARFRRNRKPWFPVTKMCLGNGLPPPRFCVAVGQCRDELSPGSAHGGDVTKPSHASQRQGELH